eukprot:747539-Hanusia_phi.AAC.4
MQVIGVSHFPDALAGRLGSISHRLLQMLSSNNAWQDISRSPTSPPSPHLIVPVDHHEHGVDDDAEDDEPLEVDRVHQ